MFTKSLWNALAGKTTFPALAENITVDTAIVGGGITGITAALLLNEKGQKTAVLEAIKVGGGTTAHSTGNLYCTVDKNLSALRSKYDAETVKKVTEARTAAINLIEQNVNRHGIDCDFKRQPWYYYSAIEENNKQVEKELEAGKEANLNISEITPGEIPMKFTKGVKVPGQAQFNALLYVQGLAKAAASENCSIYENTHVDKIEEKDDHYIIHSEGGTVKAKNVIHATHTPKGMKIFHTLLGPYREYGIACKLKDGAYPEGIFWGYYEKAKKFSIRTYEREGDKYLLVIGEPHKVGQAESNVSSIKKLEEFAHQHFNIEEVLYRWGGQHYRPADQLPYIGRESNNSRAFVATGYSTDGLTYGTLAAMIITDLIAEKENEWAKIFDPTRNQPVKAAKEFIKENVNVAKQYFKDYPGSAKDEDFAGIAPGEGKIIEKDGEKLAAFKDEKGNLQLRSAVCTHMECIVSWNNAEKTWDCPCHGSRFSTDGTVLEGPAYHPPEKINFKVSIKD